MNVLLVRSLVLLFLLSVPLQSASLCSLSDNACARNNSSSDGTPRNGREEGQKRRYICKKEIEEVFDLMRLHLLK